MLFGEHTQKATMAMVDAQALTDIQYPNMPASQTTSPHIRIEHYSLLRRLCVCVFAA